MTHRTAKVALLVALVALGLSPLVVRAQQRAPAQEAESRPESRTGEKDRPAKKEAADSEPAPKKPLKQPPPKKDSRRKQPDEKQPDRRETNKQASGEQPSKDRLSVTPEREAAVMTFVQRNHEELAQLLAHLKENQPKEYERAVRELFRASERLTLIHDRNFELYELELRLWKTQSRIQLIAARLQMGESEALRGELRELLGEQVDNRLALLRHEREKVATRLGRIDDDLERLETGREKAIDRQLQALTRSKSPKSAK